MAQLTFLQNFFQRICIKLFLVLNPSSQTSKLIDDFQSFKKARRQFQILGLNLIQSNSKMSVQQLPIQYFGQRVFQLFENSDSTDDEFNQEKKNITNAQVDFCKYKTQLCKNYTELGYCPYEKKCQFAHGDSELKSNFDSEKKHYKTKKCKKFWQKGCCSYGPRCQFLHNKHEPCQEKLLTEMTKIILFAKDSSTSKLKSVLRRNGQSSSK